MKKICVILVLSIWGVTLCAQNVTDFFSKKEITQLEQLIDFFYKKNSCFSGERDSLAFWGKNNATDIVNRFPIESWRKMLDQDLYEKIWVYGDSNKVQIMNLDGSYLEWMRKRKDKTWKKYIDDIMFAGDISPSSVTIFKNIDQIKKKNNFENKIIRVIHYLSMSIIHKDTKYRK